MYWGERERRVGYWRSVLSLIGHLVGTAVIFTVLFTLGWLVSFALHALHRYHPFPEQTFELVRRIELYLLYADSLLCAIVLIAGMVRFCKQLVWR